MCAIKQGNTIRSASKRFNVPFSTLRAKLKGISPIKKRTGGPQTILTAAEEETLVQCITVLGNKGFPLTKDMLLDSVQLLMRELRRKNPFTEDRPGRHWLEGFMRRHPVLSIKTPQNLNRRRADVNEDFIRQWFKENEDYLKSKNLLNIDKTRIFNCDESAFFLNPKGNKVILPIRQKSVYNLVGADDKECLTALITGIKFLYTYIFI